MKKKKRNNIRTSHFLKYFEKTLLSYFHHFLELFFTNQSLVGSIGPSKNTYK